MAARRPAPTGFSPTSRGTCESVESVDEQGLFVCTSVYFSKGVPPSNAFLPPQAVQSRASRTLIGGSQSAAMMDMPSCTCLHHAPPSRPVSRVEIAAGLAVALLGEAAAALWRCGAVAADHPPIIAKT